MDCSFLKLNNNLYLALWAVCFYDAVVMMLLPSSASLNVGTDGSLSRLVVDFMALAIAVLAVTTYGFKKLEQVWFGIFLVVLVVSHFHSPNLTFDSQFIPQDMAIYNYKPMFEILVFFLMFLGISSVEFTKEAIQRILQSFCWIGCAYSAYIILQRLGLDQLYNVTSAHPLSQLSRNPECGGFISQPVFAATLLAICAPFAIKLRMYPVLIVIFLGILATGNKSALIAAAICCVMVNKRDFKYGAMALFAYLAMIFGSTLLICMYPNFNFHMFYNERLLVWKNMFYDFVNPSFPGINSHYALTGHGIGSFSVLFPFYHNSSFYQAHNEFFELIWATGLLGLTTAVFMIKDFIKTITNNPICLGVLAISICAMTNSVWHVPQLAFVTVFLLGLTYNKTVGVNYE